MKILANSSIVNTMNYFQDGIIIRQFWTKIVMKRYLIVGKSPNLVSQEGLLLII
jgi:hypothetical protein